MTSTTTTLVSKLIASFIAASVAMTIVFVYVLRAPHIIIQDTALVDEYYYTNATIVASTLFGEMIASALLLMVAQYVIYATSVSVSLARLCIVAAVVAMASFVRWYANTSETDTDDGSWYARTSLKNATAYDVIYMVTLYIVLTALFSWVV
jgi:hypothetical protein